MKFYIKQNYYFDIDHRNQLRITGPENHLFLGLTLPKDKEIQIISYDVYKGQLIITAEFATNSLHLHTPLVCDIRTLRQYTEPVSPIPTYQELVEKHITDLLPKKIEERHTDILHQFFFSNEFSAEDGKRKRYGSEISVTSAASVVTTPDHLDIFQENGPIRLIIRCHTNIRITDRFTRKILRQTKTNSLTSLSPFLHDLYVSSGTHIEHLIQAKKTSSFEYGTIFPRDWIESADLGEGDLTQATVDYMYLQSMKRITATGEGWHEDAVGEYRSKFSDESQAVDRKMIDIEPRYILGIQRVSKKFLFNETYQTQMRSVAQFIMDVASSNDSITFKKTTHSPDEYHYVGNWRDSYLAYPRQKSPLAPYDTNCVFYPVCLKLILEYKDFFQIADEKLLLELITKWDQQKMKFRLYHPNGLVGYSLALHGRKSIPLPIPHLDEAYDLFYNTPSLEEVASFAKKLLDPDFFYTPAGPVLVANDEEEFSTKQYHGKVIWPKQAAYAVAGLARQYRLGKKDSLPAPFLELIKEAIIKTSEACFAGWADLGLVPELYYYDSALQKARLYVDQDTYEGQMSIIQLWSAVGCRRLIREYITLKNDVV